MNIDDTVEELQSYLKKIGDIDKNLSVLESQAEGHRKRLKELMKEVKVSSLGELSKKIANAEEKLDGILKEVREELEDLKVLGEDIKESGLDGFE